MSGYDVKIMNRLRLGVVLCLTFALLYLFFSSRIMSSKQATSPFASGADVGEDGVGQERLVWEKDEGTEPLAAPQLPIHNLLHGKMHGEELPPVSSSVPPESDWDSLVSAQQRMVRNMDE